MTDSAYWARHYTVTVDRPAWQTVCLAIDRFAAEDRTTPGARSAVDLGALGESHHFHRIEVVAQRIR